MTARPEQQTARVNIDDERWLEFRILAIESDRSIAEYLGQLVRDELRRSIRLADAKVLTELPRPDKSSRRSF